MVKRIITTLEAKELLNTNKKIVTESKEAVRLDFEKNGCKQEFNLISTEDINVKHFMLQVFRSRKKTAKISFYHRDDASMQCLFRIDFNGSHKNPDICNEHVPAEFRKYVGELITEPHVHLYVEDYEDRWALPIRVTEFKEFVGIEDIESMIQKIVDKVREYIHLVTPIIYNQTISYGT